jgi:hypothetical protein
LEHYLEEQRQKLPKPFSQNIPFAVAKYKSEGPSSDLTTSLLIDKPPKQRNPDAFPEQAFEQYLEVLNPILENEKFLKKHTKRHRVNDATGEPVIAWLRADEPVVPCDLMKQGGMQRSSAEFSEQVRQQHVKFQERTGFDEKQVQLANRALFQLSNSCARGGRGAPVEVIWQKTKELGCTDKNLLRNLLFVSATFHTGSRMRKSKYSRLIGSSILDVLDALDDDKEEKEEGSLGTTDEIAVYHDLLHEPTEQSISIRIRLLVAEGKAKEAETLLRENSDAVEFRLRAYVPVLRLFLELGDGRSAMHLYRVMRDLPSVHFDTETYVHLLAGLAEQGCFHPSADPIEIAELGYSPTAGPALLDQIVAEMAKEAIEIPEAFGKQLRNALAKGFPDSNLEETNSFAPLKLTKARSPVDDLIACRVFIEPSTGECPVTGVKLRLIHLTEQEKEKLQKSLVALAKTTEREFKEKMNKTTTKRQPADVLLIRFLDWLDCREGRPFTSIVDGANVGYFFQNFEGGRFNFHQIKFVVDSLEQVGENVLVILPGKYGNDSFTVTLGLGGTMGHSKQYQTESEIAVRDELVKAGKVSFIPFGCLDDFYWIVASVSQQKKSRNGMDLSVPAGNEEGRWPGTRPILITNDQMRDHRLEMMEPMLFRRWYSNCIVNYNFAAFVGDKCSHPEIGFSPADFFSREIQGNRDESGSMVWHFPISGKNNEWFCLRVPISVSSSENN